MGSTDQIARTSSWRGAQYANATAGAQPPGGGPVGGAEDEQDQGHVKRGHWVAARQPHRQLGHQPAEREMTDDAGTHARACRAMQCAGAPPAHTTICCLPRGHNRLSMWASTLPEEVLPYLCQSPPGVLTCGTHNNIHFPLWLVALAGPLLGQGTRRSNM